MRPNRNRRPGSTRRRIAADGRRAISLSSAKMASEVGPTQAAEPGIQGQPGNSASVGIIAFLVFFIMPKIMPTIESLHVPLPIVTRFFLSISNFLTSDWWKILLAIFFIVAIFSLLYKKSKWFKNLIHQSLVHIPIVSRIIRAHMLSEIFDTVSTLVSAGCPFIEAIGE